MSHFDSICYAVGLLVFWLGLIGLAVSLFVVASRADDIAEEWEPLCSTPCSDAAGTCSTSCPHLRKGPSCS
jgi:hypothetical protein